jgi:hypothetical protein
MRPNSASKIGLGNRKSTLTSINKTASPSTKNRDPSTFGDNGGQGEE